MGCTSLRVQSIRCRWWVLPAWRPKVLWFANGRRWSISAWRRALPSTGNPAGACLLPGPSIPIAACEFGCHYCYARYTHEFMEMWDSQDFERKIYAKSDAPERLRAELRQGAIKAFPLHLEQPPTPISRRSGSLKSPAACWKSLRISAGLTFHYHQIGPDSARFGSAASARRPASI